MAHLPQDFLLYPPALHLHSVPFLLLFPLSPSHSPFPIFSLPISIDKKKKFLIHHHNLLKQVFTVPISQKLVLG